MSLKRFTQLVKEYLHQGNLVLGLAKEEFVDGLEYQPWFQMLQYDDVAKIIDKINSSDSRHKVYTLTYAQRDLTFILDKIAFKHVVLIRGSWYRAFHLRPEYYKLNSLGIGFTMLSPFLDEVEAKAYAAKIPQPPGPPAELHGEADMLSAAHAGAHWSLDYAGFQVGVTLGRKEGKKYKPLLGTFNPVVPYQTYAMHHGASRELNFSPLGDLNHYDTNHAEVELIIEAGKQGVDLQGATLFINVLPCPTCARMFTSTGISEFVYSQDHSNGYALKMLEAAGKTVRRLVL
jgi:hypothetical protein